MLLKFSTILKINSIFSLVSKIKCNVFKLFCIKVNTQKVNKKNEQWIAGFK